MDGFRRDPNLSIKSAIWILVSLSAIFLALRLYCKRRGSGFHWDDTILVASWTALLGYVCLATIIFDTVAAQRNGNSLSSTSRVIPTEAINRLATLGLCSTTLAITSQSWSKTSFAITLLRISDGWLTWFLWAVIVSMNVLFGLGALFLWVGCSPLEKAWNPRVAGTCWDPSFNVVFGIVISAYSGVLDLVLALVPWKIILPLNMKPKEKLGCAIAMSMGIIAGVATFIKCSKLPLMGPGNGRDSLQLLIWGVIEPSVTIMAASVPAMRVLIRKSSAPSNRRPQRRVRIRDDKDPEDGYKSDSEKPESRVAESSRVATWGTKMLSWASTSTNWGSAVASRAGTNIANDKETKETKQ
ncbi:hypothetical protein QBC34DRAFT_287961 [Podospora aff. communis PSN243]|uniref:Rhodopsin domain-containing protein n=1 Tax=Podospora aff. communis PSN243 TaxID=3040156 RepID=A0AAV9H4A8_9PEZI|nr:hypothetical protein QBC34DRAFT_287961 [Podospora aff. communis PSN243]